MQRSWVGGFGSARRDTAPQPGCPAPFSATAAEAIRGDSILRTRGQFALTWPVVLCGSMTYLRATPESNSA